MLDYRFVQIDVELPLADFEVVMGGAKIVIVASDDAAATFRVEELSADRIPARPTLELCAEDGAQIGRIYVTSAGTAVAGDTLDVLVVITGNINLFSP